MSCDVLYVSCRKDLHWLYLSVRLLLKFWETDGNIVVRLDDDCQGDVANWNLGSRVTYHYLAKWPDGYAQQMFVKCLSDEYSPADLLMLIDSDVMLLAPASLDLLMHEGKKPIVEYCEWRDSPVAERVWRGPTSRVMGCDLDKDLMVGMPFLYFRDTFGKTRQRIEEVTGKSFHDAVYSDVPFHASNFLNHPVKFADYEALNLYAVKFQPEKYFLRPNSARPLNWPFRLYWSHGDWNKETEQFLTSKL